LTQSIQIGNAPEGTQESGFETPLPAKSKERKDPFCAEKTTNGLTHCRTSSRVDVELPTIGEFPVHRFCMVFQGAGGNRLPAWPIYRFPIGVGKPPSRRAFVDVLLIFARVPFTGRPEENTSRPPNVRRRWPERRVTKTMPWVRVATANKSWPSLQEGERLIPWPTGAISGRPHIEGPPVPS